MSWLGKVLGKVGGAIKSVASPLVSGAFGIGSTILNNKAQRDTNEANMQIAQMNNQWSEKMMEKQHQYDLEMWNKNNEYNTASSQRQRLEQAGLNPSLMMSGGSAGTAQGGSSVGMPSPSTPNLQPLRYEGFSQAISNTIQQSMMIAKNNAEIDAIGNTQDREDALARARIAQMQAETRNTKFRNELNDITQDLQIQNMNEDFLKKVQERSNMEEQQKLIKQQIVAQELINQNLPEKLSMEVSVLASQRDLNRHNAQSEVGKIIDTLKKKGYKLSKTMENSIFDALLYGLTTTSVGSVPELLSRAFTSGRYIKGKLNE